MTDRAFSLLIGLALVLMALGLASCSRVLGREYAPVRGPLADVYKIAVPINSGVDVFYYCYTVRGGIEVYRSDDVPCLLDARELEFYAGWLLSHHRLDGDMLKGAALVLTGQPIDCPGNPPEYRIKGEDYTGYAGCAIGDTAFVFMRGRAHTWNGWARTAWHELCHVVLHRQGYAPESREQVHHMAPCFEVPNL